ncbi:Uncharacterized protein Rs2_07733 [Raphanus sativus]|uniref:Protein SINE4 n=1 Tax=Raphanus sativus TaxID=3726 RepID=A0A6J0M5M1_RAPSA|nr:protein SINE4 [Raphanus sativus]KAJ4913112.1 Uncharacterized protein Rs2_07733 [Raphanus sativus]
MEERQERLYKQFSELEKEWAAMKTGKGSSAVSCSSTIEEALEFVENSPRKLMLSLQHDQACPEAEVRSPCRRKLFHDSDDNDDETNMTPLSHSTCWSSNVMRAGDTNNKKEKKKNKRGMIVCVISMVVFLLMFIFLAVVMMDGFDHRQINTLVPT